MKDLGYERTPTNAKLRVEMPDGSQWDVPVQLIADSRDEHYADEKEDTIGLIRSGRLKRYEIFDWAGNNMNWSDVSADARQAPLRPPKSADYEEGWSNGEKELVGDL